MFPLRRPARTGRRAADAAMALLPLLDEMRPDVVVSDILTLAPALAAEVGGAAAGDADPARLSGAASRGCRSSRSARLPAADGGRARRLWRAASPLLTAGLRARPRRAERVARASSGWRRSSASTAGSARSWRWSATFPQLEYPRRVAGARRGDRADGVRAAARRRSSCRRAMSRWWWWRRRRRRIPECRLVRAALEGLADEPVRVVATTNRHEPERADRGAGERGRSSTGSATRRRCAAADLVVCHGGHGTVARALAAGVPGAVLPGGRRHGRERRAGAVGRARADAAVAADRGAGRCGRSCRRMLGEPSLRERAPVRSPPGRRRTTAPRPAPSWSRRSSPRRAKARNLLSARSPGKLRGWDSNPQPLG